MGIRRKTEPDIDTLQKIASVLDVSIEELIYGRKQEVKMIKKVYHNYNTTENVKKGLSFGAALAMIISYVKWQSIGWAILHGLLNWFYMVYYVINMDGVENNCLILNL